MDRIYNFSAGPSMMPEIVIQKIKEQLFNYKGCGQSVMEMSHRSPEYDEIHNETKTLLREIMNIPEEYEILMLPGGATTQFSAIPLNLYKGGVADYLVTGFWAAKAAKEAEKYLKVNKIENCNKDYTFFPLINMDKIDKSADYLHITTNNTIYGTEIQEVPDFDFLPIVADMSSDILSKPYDMTKFDLVYAAAQKNMGIAGIVFIIIKKELIREPRENTPIMLSYAQHLKSNSILNTPPTFSIYVSKLIFEWIKTMGGVEGIYNYNLEKSRLIYDTIDNSGFYHGIAREDSRSITNVTFKTPNVVFDEIFIKSAKKRGFFNLGGHRVIGGMRASIYNGMPIEGVKELCKFMTEFAIEKKI